MNDDQNHPIYRRGIPVSLSSLRRVDELARATEQTTVGGDVEIFGHSGDGGLQVGLQSTPGMKGFWAQVTGQNLTFPSVYSFASVLPFGVDSVPNDITFNQDPTFFGFPSSTYNAKEVNGNKSVPIGAIVWVVPSGIEPFWEFIFPSPAAFVKPTSTTISAITLGRTILDGMLTSGTATLTSATAGFTSADVGAAVTGTGIPAGTTILTVVNSTTVTMSATATANETADTVTITHGPTARVITTGTLNSNTTLQSSASAFTSADVGAKVYGVGLAIGTQITVFTSSTQVTIAPAATRSATGVTLVIGGVPGFAAALESWSNTTGQWSDGATVWFVGANFETIQEANTRYMCTLLGVDVSGVPIYQRDIVVLSGAQLVQSTNNQSITNNTLTKITTTAFSQLNFDTDGYTGSSSGGVFNTNGKGQVFLVTVNIRWDNAVTTGERVLQIFNQAGLNCMASDFRTAVAGDFTDQSVSAIYYTGAPTSKVAVDAYVLQTSGGALNILATAASGSLIPTFSIIRLG